MTSQNQGGQVVALVRDLLFSTRITGTGKMLGVAVTVVREPANLKDATGRLLLVDLNLQGSIAAAAEWGKGAGRQVVGFVSHVDAQTIAAAREAGIGQVMARSRFVTELPALMVSPGEGSHGGSSPPAGTPFRQQ